MTPGKPLSREQEVQIEYFVRRFRMIYEHHSTYETLCEATHFPKLSAEALADIRSALSERRAKQSILELEESLKDSLIEQIVLGKLAIQEPVTYIGTFLRTMGNGGRWEQMAAFLTDWVSEGQTTALRNWRRAENGRHIWSYGWATVISFVEVAIAWAVFDKVSAGFQTIVVTIICLVYCTVAQQILDTGRISHLALGASVVSMSKSDATLFRNSEEKEQQEQKLSRAISERTGLYWLSAGKFAILQLMALALLFYKGF